MKNIKLFLILVLFSSINVYSQLKIYQNYEFNGNSNIIIESLKNGDSDKFLTTDEKGKLFLKDNLQNDLQNKIINLQDQINELKKIINLNNIEDNNNVGMFDVIISPNPNRGVFNFNLIDNKPDELLVINNLGQILKKISLINNVNEINLSYLSKGEYLLSFFKKGKVIVSKKVILE